MANAVLLVGVMLLPTLLGGAVLGAARLWRRRAARAPGPAPAGAPIERIAADVRRLRTQRSELLGRAPSPGRGVRTRALDAAYVDALGAACLALDVEPPPAGAARRITGAELARVESDLRASGLDIGRSEVS